jgi:hypothetical protein
MAFAGLLVAFLAVLVSVVSFEVNRRSAELNRRVAQDAERRGRMPVLIAAQSARQAMCVKNIGNGPALNIVVAHGASDLAADDALNLDLRQLEKQETWWGHEHLEPIASIAEQRYVWDWGQTRTIGLTYTDALGHHYTVISSVYGTQMVDGYAMQRPKLKHMDYGRLVEAPN